MFVVKHFYAIILYLYVLMIYLEELNKARRINKPIATNNYNNLHSLTH